MRTVQARLNVGATTRRQDLQPSVAAAAVLCAASMLALGVWAFGWPESFARFIDYAPYNRHLIHDVGAFQMGIGLATLVALMWSDSLLVALTGFAIASGLHAVSHAVDRHVGGHAGDVPALGTLTLVALYAIFVRLHRRTS
jgi:hypothetical protein